MVQGFEDVTVGNDTGSFFSLFFVFDSLHLEILNCVLNFVCTTL